LDDPHSEPCGKCANCLGHRLLEPEEDHQRVIQASLFLRHSEFPLKPKKQVAANAFPTYGFRGNLPAGLQAETGRVLSRWGDAAWGYLVEQGKEEGYFSDELVDAMAEMIQQRWQPENRPHWLCAVPSLTTPVFLFDDMVDSGWTMTVIAALLKQQGASYVYPIALASTASGD